MLPFKYILTNYKISFGYYKLDFVEIPDYYLLFYIFIFYLQLKYHYKHIYRLQRYIN